MLALAAYAPIFATHPGKLAADTKSYLYLDPGGVMRQAFYMWDPSVGTGTVTHQYIGYLFPMGPYYWLVQHMSIPMWIGQRFWLGSIFFGAGAGALFFLRHLHIGGLGRPIAAFAFMATPYTLSYAARLSALLLPWAAIGWLVGLTALSVRRGGWRYPALFALVVLLAGTVNATSLIYAGFAPLLFLPYAVWVTRECTVRDALTAVFKIALLSVAVLAWMITGLAIEFAYALNIVIYTESIPTVTLTSSASEVLRGLGYWYFYGEDQIDHYIQAAPSYMRSIWYLIGGFAVPAVQFALGAMARWRYKAYCVLLVLVGTLLAVGAYPYRHSTLFGSLLKQFQSAGIAGLALRSDNRAVPVLLLGLAGLAAAGLTAIWERQRQLAALAAIAVAGGAAATLPALWTGKLLGNNLLFPSNLPSYYRAYAHYLDAHRTATRVLAEPGDDFAYYSWGTTIDPVDPALITRPFVAREQVPYGSAASADLLNAFDQTLQEQTFDPESLAPIARLMSVGDVVLRSDLAYERFNSPRPQATWTLFEPPPPGLGRPVTFGAPHPVLPAPYPLVDETSLAQRPSAPWPPELAAFPVTDTRAIVRSEPASHAIVIDGDGMGVVAAADAGLVDNNDTLFYAASFARQGHALRQILNSHAELVVTDTDYRAQKRWGTLRENVGYIQQPGEPVLATDPIAHALPIFPGQSVRDQSVARLNGVAHVVATSYGNPISFVPENQPYNAFDGNPETVWTTGAFADPVGQRIRAELSHPVTTDHLVFVQPLTGPRDRYITRITITLGPDHTAYGNHHTPIGTGDTSFANRGGPSPRPSSLTVNLTHASRTLGGQVVRFPTRTFSTLEVRIDRINIIHEVAFAGVSGVGFAEIRIPGVTLHEVVQMPTDLLSVSGSSSLSHPLVFLVNRRRAPPVPPRSDPELAMAREFTLPRARTFSLSGTARISALIPDQTIDQLMGRPGSDYTGIVASSSGRLPGDLNARASMALDGDASTAWMPGIGPQKGNWLQVDFPQSRTFEHLDLQLVADGRHSVPMLITLSSSSGHDTVAIPHVRDIVKPNATVTVPISFPALTGRWLRLTVDKARDVVRTDYYSNRPDIEPVGIAELGIPGVTIPPVPGEFPAVCRDDLLAIDGRPVGIAVSGTNTIAASEQGQSLTFTGCGPDSRGVAIGSGSHLLTTADGAVWQHGLSIDTVALASDAGGEPMKLDGARLPSPVPPQSPPLHILSQTPTSYAVSVAHAASPFWLVLGQSLNRGWNATITKIGKRAAHIGLGTPVLIDAMSNGWMVDPTHLASGPIVVQLNWEPQHWVLPVLLFSAIAVLVCLGLALWPRRKKAGATVAPQALASPSHTPSLRRVIVAGVAMACISGVFVNAWLALPVGAVTGLACRIAPLRKLVGISAPLLMLATGIYYATEEGAYGWHALFGWPSHFQTASSLAWLAILALCTWTASQAANRPVRQEPLSPAAGSPEPK